MIRNKKISDRSQINARDAAERDGILFLFRQFFQRVSNTFGTSDRSLSRLDVLASHDFYPLLSL